MQCSLSLSLSLSLSDEATLQYIQCTHYPCTTFNALYREQILNTSYLCTTFNALHYTILYTPVKDLVRRVDTRQLPQTPHAKLPLAPRHVLRSGSQLAGTLARDIRWPGPPCAVDVLSACCGGAPGVARWRRRDPTLRVLGLHAPRPCHALAAAGTLVDARRRQPRMWLRAAEAQGDAVQRRGRSEETAADGRNSGAPGTRADAAAATHSGDSGVGCLAHNGVSACRTGPAKDVRTAQEESGDTKHTHTHTHTPTRAPLEAQTYVRGESACTGPAHA